MNHRALVALLVLTFVSGLTGSACAVIGASDDEYVFVPMPEREVAIWHGDYLLVGKLDSEGDFLQQKQIKLDGAYSGRYAFDPINVPSRRTDYAKPEPAYEYRSGRLIEGTIWFDNQFVPALRSKRLLKKPNFWVVVSGGVSASAWSETPGGPSGGSSPR
jgi:hypothetical protein